MAVLENIEFEGLEGLRVGRIGDRVNTSCIVYRLGETVIDTGPANQWGFVRRFLSEREIMQVLLTHHHEDHCGNGNKIQKQFRAPIYVHPEGVEPCKRGFKVPLYRRLVWGKPRRFDAMPMPESIQAGDFRLKMLHTPGHSPDLVCFLEASRGWLFTGDLYVSSSPRFLREGESPSEEIKSLELVLKQQFDTVLCSHRGVLVSGYEALQKKLKYLVALREQVWYYRELGDPVKQICERILGKEEMVRWFSLGEFSKANYIQAFVDEARRLEQAERISKMELDSI